MVFFIEEYFESRKAFLCVFLVGGLHRKVCQNLGSLGHSNVTRRDFLGFISKIQHGKVVGGFQAVFLG